MKSDGGFAVWITGLPSSGKSTLAKAVVRRLGRLGVEPAVLESDAMRAILPLGYDENGRDAFYGAMLWVGKLLTAHSVPVIFDATANRRRYRDSAREAIDRFMEVYVDSPLDLCMHRDVKGIYRGALSEGGGAVPGLGAEYEPPIAADVVVSGAESVEGAADRVVDALAARGYLDRTRRTRDDKEPQ